MSDTWNEKTQRFNPDMINKLAALYETILGGALMSLSWWAQAFATIGSFAHDIAMICGGVIGVHGVYRLLRGRPLKRRD